MQQKHVTCMQSSDESQGERGKYFVAHGEVVRTGSPWEHQCTSLLKLHLCDILSLSSTTFWNNDLQGVNCPTFARNFKKRNVVGKCTILYKYAH